MCPSEPGPLDVLCPEPVPLSLLHVRGPRGGTEVTPSFLSFPRTRESDVRAGCSARADRDGGPCARATWGQQTLTAEAPEQWRNLLRAGVSPGCRSSWVVSVPSCTEVKCCVNIPFRKHCLSVQTYLPHFFQPVHADVKYTFRAATGPPPHSETGSSRALSRVCLR